MSSLNGYIVAALMIHGLMAWMVGYEYPPLGAVMFGSVGLGLVGLALMLVGKTKVGAWTFLVSSVLFVPIGMIGMIGARKNLDRLAQAELLQRRCGIGGTNA